MEKILCVSLLLFTLLQSVCAKNALIIVDVQNCFLSGGSLAVTNGNDVIPVINRLRTEYSDEFSLVVLTQDWHCPDHVSFVTQHQDSKIYDDVLLQYNAAGKLCKSLECDVKYNVSQTIWPEHCIMNTEGANFSSELAQQSSDFVVRKGFVCDVDSYSGFYDNGGFSYTELESILRSHHISKVFITGLALDYCVYYTAKDANKLGFQTFLVEDASRPVTRETANKAIADLHSIGVHVITSEAVGKALDETSSAKSVTSCGCFMMLFTVLMSTIFK